MCVIWKNIQGAVSIKNRDILSNFYIGKMKWQQKENKCMEKKGKFKIEINRFHMEK